MTLSRRSLMKAGLATYGAASLCGSGCGNDVSAAPFTDVTVGDDSTDSSTYGKVTITVPMFPDLAPIGGALNLRIAALPPGNRPFTVPTRGVLLVHRGAPGDMQEYIATRADCPHQGCPLGYSLKDGLIECPCHGSRFLAASSATDPTQCAGLVVHPPAKDNLTVYGATVSSDGLTVTVDLTTNDSCGVASGIPPVMNGTITIPLAQFPALSNVGGSIVGAPTGLGDTLIIARTDQTTVIATSAICTHKGCTVMLDEPDMRLSCPCHGSQFSFSGAVLNSPATLPLKAYAVTFDGTTITITAS